MASNVLMVLREAWTIFWITSLYAFLSTGLVEFFWGYKTGGDKAKIDKRVDQFVSSPLYVATFFSLFAVLFFWRGTKLIASAAGSAWALMFALGLLVMLGHALTEVIENTVTRKDPTRMLRDPEWLKLSGVYFIVICQTTLLANLTQ